MRRVAAALMIWTGAVSCISPLPPDASGIEIYLQLCSRCHGDDLAGGIGPALGPGSNTAEQDDEFLELTIMQGRGRMPAFGSTLSADQLHRLSSFIRERQR